MDREELDRLYMNAQARKQKQSELIDKLQQQLEAFIDSENPPYEKIDLIANTINLLTMALSGFKDSF